MFDALVNLELISRTAVEDHLIETTLRPEWRATKATASTVYHLGNHAAAGRTLAETAVACQIDEREDLAMPVSSLDHVNIRTSNLKDMVSFYSKVLGLTKGKRPAFKFGGAWLYAGNRAAVHLVEVQKQPKLKDPQLEHFAFKENDINGTLKKLQKLVLDTKRVLFRVGKFARSTLTTQTAITSKSRFRPARKRIPSSYAVNK